jgi:hypothetical protein
LAIDINRRAPERRCGEEASPLHGRGAFV